MRSAQAIALTMVGYVTNKQTHRPTYIHTLTHSPLATLVCWTKTFYKTCKIFHLLGLYKFILLILVVSHTTDISVIFFLTYSEHSNPFHEFFSFLHNSEYQIPNVSSGYKMMHRKWNGKKIINFCNSMFQCSTVSIYLLLSHILF